MNDSKLCNDHEGGLHPWTNTLHRTRTAIPFPYSRGYKRVSAACTRAVDISSSPYEEPRVPFVQANREVYVGFGDQDTPPMLPLLHPSPEGQERNRATDQRDRQESKKGAPSSFSPRRSGEKWCRLIPTMRPLLGDLLDTRVMGMIRLGLERPLTKPRPP